MSVQVITLDEIVADEVDSAGQARLALRAAINETVDAYIGKAIEQVEARAAASRGRAYAKRRGMPPPVRDIRDDPSQYDEGEVVATIIRFRRTLGMQGRIPVFEKEEHLLQWPIPDLKQPLAITKDGYIARPVPSVVKKRKTCQLIPLDHPMVIQQLDDILRGLDAMRFALREV